MWGTIYGDSGLRDLAELAEVGDVGALFSDTELLALAASEEENNRRARNSSSGEPVGIGTGDDSSATRRGALDRTDVDRGDGQGGSGPGDVQVYAERTSKENGGIGFSIQMYCSSHEGHRKDLFHDFTSLPFGNSS